MHRLHLPDLPSRHQHMRRLAMAPRLESLLAYLDTLPDRRSPLSAADSGPARRVLAEAAALTDRPGESLRRHPRPVEILVETLRIMQALGAKNMSTVHELQRIEGKSYPRSPEQE